MKNASIEKKLAVCAHDCPDSCGVLVSVENGQLLGLAGDPDHPITQGLLCGKVARYKERVESPLRVKTPLRRVGAKGEGKFEPISWQAALSEIAERFQRVAEEHGPEAILPYSYGGTIAQVGFNIGHRFFYALGASRLERTICTGSASAGVRGTMGIGLATDVEEVANAKLILLWGINAVATHIHLMPLIKKARKAGAHVVLIDTYRTATAQKADEYIQIRPGTDAAFALGMMRVILSENLHNEDFVEQYTIGIGELRSACEDYTPARVEEITGVPAEVVVRLGRMYAAEPQTFIRMGLGPSRHSNGAMTVRTVSCLPGLTGAWGAKGGGFLSFAWGCVCQGTNFLQAPPADTRKARQVNMVQLGKALTELSDPPIHALYVYNSNPAAITPEQARVHQGLAREDLFVVVHEQVLTDTTDFADIVLPATTFLEHDDVSTSYGHNYLQLSRAAIEPIGEAKSNLDTFSLLAKEIGLTDPVFQMSFEEIAQRLVAGLALEQGETAWEDFWAGRPVKLTVDPAPWEGGLNTPSGKFEFYSSRLEKLGHPPLPAFVPSEEGHLDNDLKARFPLQLLTPPSQHFLNSSFGDTDSSRRLEAQPRLKIHPKDAEARGLVDGASCRVYNDRGDCQLVVQATEDVAAGVVVAESIWWPKLMPGRKGINQLTSDELTDQGGCARFHDGLVQVEAL